MEEKMAALPVLTLLMVVVVVWPAAAVVVSPLFLPVTPVAPSEECLDVVATVPRSFVNAPPPFPATPQPSPTSASPFPISPLNPVPSAAPQPDPTDAATNAPWPQSQHRTDVSQPPLTASHRPTTLLPGPPPPTVPQHDTPQQFLKTKSSSAEPNMIRKLQKPTPRDAQLSPVTSNPSPAPPQAPGHAFTTSYQSPQASTTESALPYDAADYSGSTQVGTTKHSLQHTSTPHKFSNTPDHDLTTQTQPDTSASPPPAGSSFTSSPSPEHALPRPPTSSSGSLWSSRLLETGRQLEELLKQKIPPLLDLNVTALFQRSYLQRLRLANHEMVDRVLQTNATVRAARGRCPLGRGLRVAGLRRVLGLLLLSLPHSLTDVYEAAWDPEIDNYFFRQERRAVLDVSMCRQCYMRDPTGYCRQLFFCKDGASVSSSGSVDAIMMRLNG